jgi:hypothetical protein
MYSAGGFSLEKLEISALKEIETLAKPGDDVNVRHAVWFMPYSTEAC